MAITQPLRLWHLTSLDAPTVAVTWLLAFAWSTNIHLPLWLPLVLALITWSTYITDRLLDAWNAARSNRNPGYSLLPGSLQTGLRLRGVTPYSLLPTPYSLSPRHLFHWQYRKLFLPTAITSVLAALILIHHNMPPAARERNTILAAATLAYFSAVHNPWHPKLRIPKELLVAILFTLACTLPTLTRMADSQITLAAPILVFTALAWLNCYAIEAWESNESNAPTSILKPALTLAAATLIAAAANHHHPGITLLLLTATASTALLALLNHVKPKLHPTTLRALADLVLLTPAALLFLSK